MIIAISILIPFFLLEVCTSFSIIWNFIRIQSQLSATQCIIPLVIHYSVFFIKIALLYQKSLNRGQINNKVWIATLLLQSSGLGFMSLFYKIPICFLQVLIFVQYVIALSLDDYYKPSVLVVLNFLIPEIFKLANQTHDLLEKIVEAIIAIYLLYYLIQKRKIQNQDVIDVLELRSAVKSKSLFHLSLLNRMPFLTNESFAIINDKIEIVYEQKLGYFLEENQDFIQYEETKKEILFQNLLDIKCDSFSLNLSKLMIQQEQSIGQKQIRTKVQLDIICSQILSEETSPKEFFQIYELESQFLKLQNVKLNLYALMDVESKYQMIIVHFEQYQEKKLIQTKSFGTISNPIQNASFLTGHKTQDSVSSSLFSNIFKSISHEFGTYLNCILTIGQLGTLSEFIDLELKRQYFEPIFINAKLLNYILQNIRDFNMILQNKFQLRLQEFNPLDILNEIKYLMAQQAESRNNTIELNCAEDITIHSDSDRFKQVIYQLVSNSIRFTQNGQIYIEITNNKDKIKVTVIDQGIGMSLDEQNKLIQLLRDSKKMLKISHNSVGCGLGLSISNEIVKKMNGSNSGIHFTSQLNLGSTFHFTITNAVQLYNESQYNHSQSIVKVINEAYYIEKASEYSHRMSMSGYQFLPLDDKCNDSLEKYNTLGFKQKSASYRKRSYDTSHQFLHRQTENSNSKGKSDDYANNQEMSLIVIPNMETKMKTNIIQYKISSACCKRVLVIDDEYFNIFTLQMILSRYNVKIDSAFNGKQALEKCSQKMAKPCKICKNSGYMVIFIDLNMPVMDGFATIKELKSQMKENIIPRGLCIVNSGFSDFESKEKADAAGADMYLTKPVNIIELEDYLREHFPNCL